MNITTTPSVSQLLPLGAPGSTADVTSNHDNPNRPQAIESAAQDFEAMFVSLLIKQLRETLQDGLFTKETSDSFGAMFDMYMGEHLAQASPLGLGRAVSKYMEVQNSQ